VIFGLFLWSRSKKLKPAVRERPKVQETVNTASLAERVYATLGFAESSSHPVGRELTLTVAQAKGADKIEYELEYQAGTLVQAGLGRITPAEEEAPYKRDILLGSCSAGGACSYHQDVLGGTLLLRFKNSQAGNLKGEWNFYQPGNDGKFGSRDAKFQLEAAKLKTAFVVISQTLGLPESVDGEVVAGPYHLETTASSTGEMAATVHLAKEGEAKLWRWDGKMYREVPSSVNGKTLTAKLKEPGTYLAVE
jgi:hypothetical protein